MLVKLDNHMLLGESYRTWKTIGAGRGEAGRKNRQKGTGGGLGQMRPSLLDERQENYHFFLAERPTLVLRWNTREKRFEKDGEQRGVKRWKTLIFYKFRRG